MSAVLTNSHAFFAHIPPLLSLFIPYFALVGFVMGLIALFLALSLRQRLIRLSLGRAGSLEETINILSRDSREMKEFKHEVEKYLQFTEARLRGALQGVGVVRFNPFAGAGQGGNQSFAMAFLDESGSGVVLSTLYARERVGVYCKPIEKGTPLFELSGEEAEAVAKAKASIASRKKPSAEGKK